MDQWEAEIDTALFCERELGEYDIIEGCICCFIASFFRRAGNAFAVDWHYLCNTMNIAKRQKNKVRGVRTLRDKTCSILIADEKLESRLKIRERDISSKIRVLPDPVWTDAEK